MIATYPTLVCFQLKDTQLDVEALFFVVDQLQDRSHHHQREELHQYLQQDKLVKDQQELLLLNQINM